MLDPAPYPFHEALAPIKDQMHLWWSPNFRRTDETEEGIPLPSYVPYEHVDGIAAFLSNVVAELLESYLDAGSEREAIVEDIFPAVHDLVLDWTDPKED
jgi:hypothetical protein